MNTKDITALQHRIGAVPDGFWGPKSIATCQEWLRQRFPKPNPWPTSDQASLTKFYGRAGDESKLVALPVADLGLLYEGKPVKSIRCHAKVAESLKRVLTEISQGPAKAVLKAYAGCFNNRAMRGGSLPSLHARGAAVDFDPDHNGNHVSWPVAATMPIEIMEAFSREGWMSAGAFWSRDAMHFQATR